MEKEQTLKWIYFIALSSLSGQETHLHCKVVIINSELQQIIQHFALLLHIQYFHLIQPHFFRTSLFQFREAAGNTEVRHFEQKHSKEYGNQHLYSSEHADSYG